MEASFAFYRSFFADTYCAVLAKRAFFSIVCLVLLFVYLFFLNFKKKKKKKVSSTCPIMRAIYNENQCYQCSFLCANSQCYIWHVPNCIFNNAKYSMTKFFRGIESWKTAIGRPLL